MSLVVGSKTPVSVLQEYLFKIGEVPQYELIYDGTGTHTPTFVYRLRFKNHSVEGRGSTKKEAKQDTARLMLEILNTTEEAQAKIEPDTISLCKSSNKYNAVGALTEYCMGMKLYQGPAYSDVREEGPPHARLFTVRCTVSQQSETAIAGTKKQAKQQAAQQMLNKLRGLNIFNDYGNVPAPHSFFTQHSKVEEADPDLVQNVIAHFNSLRVFNAQFVYGGSISQYHTSYKGDNTFTSETVNNIIERCKKQESVKWDLTYIFENYESLFTEVQTEMGVEGVFCQLPSKKKGVLHCVLSVNHSPQVTFLGSGENEERAKQSAVVDYLHYISVLKL